MQDHWCNELRNQKALVLGFLPMTPFSGHSVGQTDPFPSPPPKWWEAQLWWCPMLYFAYKLDIALTQFSSLCFPLSEFIKAEGEVSPELLFLLHPLNIYYKHIYTSPWLGLSISSQELQLVAMEMSQAQGQSVGKAPVELGGHWGRWSAENRKEKKISKDRGRAQGKQANRET